MQHCGWPAGCGLQAWAGCEALHKAAQVPLSQPNRWHAQHRVPSVLTRVVLTHAALTHAVLVYAARVHAVLRHAVLTHIFLMHAVLVHALCALTTLMASIIFCNDACCAEACCVLICRMTSCVTLLQCWTRSQPTLQCAPTQGCSRCLQGSTTPRLRRHHHHCCAHRVRNTVSCSHVMQLMSVTAVHIVALATQLAARASCV